VEDFVNAPGPGREDRSNVMNALAGSDSLPGIKVPRGDTEIGSLSAATLETSSALEKGGVIGRSSEARSHAFLYNCKCNANNLILEILKHDKMINLGICISVLHSKFWGNEYPSPP